MTFSDSCQHFGHSDFDLERIQRGYPRSCPVRNCLTQLVPIRYRRSPRLFCPVHGIRLHSDTFAYWNGQDRPDQARLRNFPIRPDLALEVALRSKDKAESHRLGYELSEDALSWNVFVGLADAGKLRQAVQFLTGRSVGSEPRLYLWGDLVDPREPGRERFTPLHEVRRRLEHAINRFQTEPDIMLVNEGEFLVCIEAKFCSGNPISHDKQVNPGEKPTSRRGLLDRYLGSATERTRQAISPDLIGERFHSQLFRNIVFASEMAKGADWYVVNLVSSTQWANGTDSAEYSFANPEGDVRCYLRDDQKWCFAFRTWEALHETLVKGDPSLESLNVYMRSKSARYLPVFRLG